ncbi:GRAMD2B isoform 7 [Pongo abelii]|uniref:GRAMD2B isoform 7 n=1 Tax=Pongo abelii TaxID=9601 RepID=A0A2J8XE52_PONAB|nr:GRAMD2B isoform 7 [Pongo abelii]
MTELQQDVEDTKPAKVLGKRESKLGSAHSEAENGVEEKKKACRSPTAQSPTPSVEAESPDQKKIISLRPYLLSKSMPHSGPRVKIQF